jgi:hypothetical protein
MYLMLQVWAAGGILDEPIAEGWILLLIEHG